MDPDGRRAELTRVREAFHSLRLAQYPRPPGASASVVPHLAPIIIAKGANERMGGCRCLMGSEKSDGLRIPKTFAWAKT